MEWAFLPAALATYSSPHRAESDPRFHTSEMHCSMPTECHRAMEDPAEARSTARIRCCRCLSVIPRHLCKVSKIVWERVTRYTPAPGVEPPDEGNPSATRYYPSRDAPAQLTTDRERTTRCLKQAESSRSLRKFISAIAKRLSRDTANPDECLGACKNGPKKRHQYGISLPPSRRTSDTIGSSNTAEDHKPLSSSENPTTSSENYSVRNPTHIASGIDARWASLFSDWHWPENGSTDAENPVDIGPRDEKVSIVALPPKGTDWALIAQEQAHAEFRTPEEKQNTSSFSRRFKLRRTAK